MMNKKGLETYRKICPEAKMENAIYSFTNINDNDLLNTTNIIYHDNNIKKTILESIKYMQPLSIARYNDGEWIAICRIMDNNLYNIHKVKWDTAGQIFVDTNLTPIIKKPINYPIGISTEILKKQYVMKHVLPYIIQNKLFDGGLFARWSLENNFIDFFSTLKQNKNIILIGPDYLKNMKKFFNFIHIKTNVDKIWNDYKLIKDNLYNILNEKNNTYIILYCCSFVGKKLIDDVYHKYNNSMIQLDIGAAFEPYCKMNIRPWHKFIR